MTSPGYSISSLSLQVVPLNRVCLHERVDPQRVEKLARRLAAEGRLINPPIVFASGDYYVVLDGANRTEALRQLGYPYSIVQVVTDRSQLDLHTWLHAVRQADSAQLIKVLSSLPEISLTETSADKVLDDMLEFGGLCYLHTIEGRVFLIQPASAVNHLDALNKLTEAYIGAYRLSRTLNNDLSSLSREFSDLTALVVFPQYTVEQVLQIAQAGRVLPAGITRFIIPGRVLRLYADLDHLKTDGSLAEKNSWLKQLLLEKLNQNKIRFYQESVYLLDE